MKKQVLSAILLAAMLLQTVACGESGSQRPDGSGSGDSGETTASESDDVNSKFPQGLDFGGAKLNIMGWEGTSGIEFDAENLEGEIVNDAIYNRNRNIESHLNVKLGFTLIPGNNANLSTWMDTVRASIYSGEGEIDIIGGYSKGTATLAYDRLLLNLLDQNVLNFDEPWWNSSIINESSIGGKLYFATGDISTNLTHSMYCVFFNKKLAEDYNMGNLYDIVRSGQWTIDKLNGLIKNTYADLNASDSKDAEDQYGFITRNVTTDAFFYSGGFRSTKIGNNGYPELVFDSQGEGIHSLLEKLVTYFADDPWYKTADGNLDELNLIFTSGRAVFIMSEALFATTDLRYSGIDYGVLPVPKGSEEVKDYQTCTKHTYTLYGIPIDANNPEMSAAVLECMAVEGYYNITSALFETALKVKYSSDNDSAEMYDIIRSNLVFEFGRIYNESLSNLTWSMFRNNLANDNSDWFSKYDAKKETLETLFSQLISQLTEN